jgi:hypothetical protein
MDTHCVCIYTDTPNSDQREDVINGLRTFFKSDKTWTMDTQQIVDSLDSAVELMNLFFQIVGILAMVIHVIMSYH